MDSRHPTAAMLLGFLCQRLGSADGTAELATKITDQFQPPIGIERQRGEGDSPWIEVRVRLQNPGNLGELNFGGVVPAWISSGRSTASNVISDTSKTELAGTGGHRPCATLPGNAVKDFRTEKCAVCDVRGVGAEVVKIAGLCKPLKLRTKNPSRRCLPG